jgi:hypothetical protein
LLFSSSIPAASSNDATTISSSTTDSDKPFAYLLVSLVLVDLRSSLHTLLEQLNSASYPSTSGRLASAYDIVSHFVGFLVRSLDDSDQDTPSSNDTLSLSPSLLLSLRKSLSEMLSATIEHLRDRYDAAVAGAQGLHPSARLEASASGGGPRLLTWDTKSSEAGLAGDPFVLAAVRALAIWLREDDGEALRREGAGLVDMFVEMYSSNGQDFRRPVLVALEGITAAGDEGMEALLSHDGWRVLAEDVLGILHLTSSKSGSGQQQKEDAARGVEIVRVLLPIVEAESTGSREEWMALVTSVAGWHIPDYDAATVPALVVEEFWVAVLQLVTALLANTHDGMRKRYRHSTTAVIGIATALRQRNLRDDTLKGDLDDVIETLGEMR